MSERTGGRPEAERRNAGEEAGVPPEPDAGAAEGAGTAAGEEEPDATAAAGRKTPSAAGAAAREEKPSGAGPSAENMTAHLSAQIEEELAELEELRDRHLRLAAEFENYRKRTRREQSDLWQRAQADLVRDLLETLDDLSRMAETPGDTVTVETLQEAVGLIHRKLRKALEEAGLSRIEALGARFDPTLHEALLVTEVDDPSKDEIITQVLVEGYRFRDRLLRPAQVGVARYAKTEAEAAGRDDGPDPGAV
ncbi:MAG: nucleotide exchange factor GrpE [Gemmatimonadota bacterium]